MDEPLGALDKNLRTHLQIELETALQRQLGVTVVSRWTQRSGRGAHHVGPGSPVMNHGAVEQVGTPEELYEEPATQFVAGFVGESNTLAGTLVQVRADCSEDPPGQRVLVVRQPSP